MRRYRITVDQAAIRREDPNPIIVHDLETDERRCYSDVGIDGRVIFRTNLAGELDGARVYAETEEYPKGIISTGTKP